MRRFSWKHGENLRLRRSGLLGLLLLACSLPGPALAQLDPTCTVSILNRTSQARADGSWRIDNVPANLGPVRARATCVRSGLTVSGQSDYFRIQSDSITGFPSIPLGAVEPIPVSLAVTSPVARLTPAQSVVQLAVIATYPDGATADVAAAAAGTSYTISNPAVASLSPDGLLTALTSGTVLISATQDGALGLVQVTVQLSADGDGDGLPDDYELAHGLNPNDPADALSDPDQDGLTVFAEFQRGLDPFRADTDGDGLRDGDEVNLYGTNPLLVDTDGDEVADGLEVQTGSDPLDPASFNLASILTGLTVQPSSFTLVFNTILGEASRRLDVRGRLVDGRTIDLRRRSRGTNYGSSSLAVASFGAEDGRVFAGQDGTAVVTVTNLGFSATVAVTVTSFSPTALSYLSLPGSANGVDVSGDFAYVAAGQAGLVVVDVSDLQAPRIAAVADTPGNANDVKVDGGYAYVADGRSGLAVIDVRDPLHPALAGRLGIPGDASDLAVRGGRAYLAEADAGLAIVDVLDPASPLLLGTVDTPGRAHGVDSDGILALVADGGAGLAVFDVRNPASPSLLGATATRPNATSHAADVVLRGRFAYLADGADLSLGGLRVIDLLDPTTPVVVGSSSDAFGLTALAVDGKLALGSDFYFPNTVPIFDIGLGTADFAARLDFFPSFTDADGNGIAVSNGVAFLAATQGIVENGVVMPGGLFIGRYLIQNDTEGIPPRVSITSPADGAGVPERSPLVVQADASDDLMVASVQFLIDGVPFFDDTKAPFEAVLTVPAGGPSFTLSATAIDFGGNRATALPVTVAVLPDTGPRATLLVPVAGQRFSEGVEIDLAAAASDDVRIDQVEFFVDGVSIGALTSPPYRLSFFVPVGASQFSVQAVATDSAGQTGASDLVVAGIDDDPAPIVAVVAPTPGTQLVAGMRIVVGVGATDVQGVTRVQLAIDGVPGPEDFDPPYQFPLVVPTAGTELVLTATAEDSIGQLATAEARFPIVPDPATTASGRVLDSGGLGVSGAIVRCAGVGGVSGAGGSFSVVGVPTVVGRISCGATATQGGDLLEGRSVAVPPVAGGTTEVGDVVLASRFLYLGSGNGPSELEPGRLLVFDEANDRYIAWSRPLPPAGLSGLAFDGQDRLFGTTLPPQPFPTFAGVVKVTPGGGSGGQLVRLDPDSGEVVATIGPVTVEGGAPSDLTLRAKAFSTGIDVQDLTYDPAADRFYALEHDFGSRLYTVDVATGHAVVLSENLSYSSAALALGPDGMLYLLAATGSGLRLSVIDPADGSVVSTDPVSGTLGAAAGDTVGGMVLRPGTGTFLVTAAFNENDLYDLDPLSRQLTELAEPEGVVEGGLLALALRRVAGASVVTTLAGLVVDGDAVPVAGAEVSSLGAFGTTGPDGRFELVGVRVRTGSARVAARSGASLAFSAAQPPVPGGVTDLGTIVLGAPVCVTFTLSEFRCLQGPVVQPVDLYLEDDQGQRTPLGQLTPDPSGRYCADLRPGRRYFARREDFECYCGRVSPCEARLAVSDPGAAGTCGAPGSTCQDLGDVQLQCDLFCGS
jgi:hypothetical protein